MEAAIRASRAQVVTLALRRLALRRLDLTGGGASILDRIPSECVLLPKIGNCLLDLSDIEPECPAANRTDGLATAEKDAARMMTNYHRGPSCRGRRRTSQ